MLTNTRLAVGHLCAIATSTRAWALAALGSMRPSRVREFISDAQIHSDLLPLQLLSTENCWLRNDSVFDALNFVQRQTVFG